ncbi:MAG: TonB-dependent receptor [Candidatus Azobacteroides sp.]|nr:TonB-dependent receptor [Candidatus Azobacteroides sp.]
MRNLIRYVMAIGLLMALPVGAVAQQITVKGKVTDAAGDPLIGVAVTVKGTTNGTMTDLDGSFSLQTEGNATISFSYLGMDSVEMKVTGTTMNVRLQESSTSLDEVVVIGYGTQKRRDVTTAVSTVSTRTLDSRPIISADQAMQGQAAGVSVTSPNGQPGQNMVVRVRGTTSFNGSNDPLYVVDGVPIADNNISYLSTNDIESIHILKDASSAAIYGSRAANGVVLITTKQGQKGDAKIGFSSYAGATMLTNKIEPLNMAEYRDYLKDLGSTLVLPDNLTDQTDWYKETYRTGLTQNYQLSVANSKDNFNYYISGGYTHEDGIIKIASFDRYNFRANMDNQIRKWLLIGTNVAYSDYTTVGNIVSGQGANRGGVIVSVVNTPTFYPVWDPDHPGQYYNFSGINLTTPVDNMGRSENDKANTNRLLATGRMEITFSPELKLKSSITMDRTTNTHTNFYDPEKITVGRSTHGFGQDERSTGTVMTYDNILTYNKTFGPHALEVMGGTSGTTSKWNHAVQQAQYFYDSQMQTLNTANKVDIFGTYTEAADWAIMSYLGRVSYNFNSKYLFSANMRADGSSRLAPGHKWGYFPSASAAWRISSEDFMKNVSWIDDLKLRGGWGQTGNQSGLGDYGYLARYNITRQDWTNPLIGSTALPLLSPASLSTRDLTWETTTQTNLGLDFTLLKNRLNFMFDVYYKKTTNMLMHVTLPTGSATVDKIDRNEGEMTNKGLELTVNSQNLVGAFKWETNFNISFNRNKLTKLTFKKIYYDAVVGDQIKDYAVRNMPGRSLGSFYGYVSHGVDPETGDLILSDEPAYIGDPNPDFTFGMTNTFLYKNFELNILLQGSYGNDIFNASKIETQGMYDSRNQAEIVVERWKRPGMITKIPKAGFLNDDMVMSSYFIEDGSYMRIKNVTLSYRFSGKILNKWGINRLQPYITASNLLTLTKYSGMDPEVNQWGNNGGVQGVDWGTYPQTKSVIFGVNVEF